MLGEAVCWMETVASPPAAAAGCTAVVVAEVGAVGAIGSGSWVPWGEESHEGTLWGADATKQA